MYCFLFLLAGCLSAKVKKIENEYNCFQRASDDWSLVFVYDNMQIYKRTESNSLKKELSKTYALTFIKDSHPIAVSYADVWDSNSPSKDIRMANSLIRAMNKLHGPVQAFYGKDSYAWLVDDNKIYTVNALRPGVSFEVKCLKNR